MSQADAKPKATTAEEQLKLLRSGYAEQHELKLGDLVLPCRLMPAQEEAAIIGNAKASVKAPSEAHRGLFESMAVMKEILFQACMVDKTPYASKRFLDGLTDVELDALYDQYMTIKETANPQFEKLSPAKIGELFEAVKKKERSSKDFFTWQLAAIGKFCLDQIQAGASGPGS